MQEKNKNSSQIDLKSEQDNKFRISLKQISAPLVAMAIYIVIMSYFCILRYESFTAVVYDLGIMIQVVYNTSHGWILKETVNMGYPMMRFWMAHWEFIYLPIAIVYKVFSSPYTIIIIQTFTVALGVLPIYWLSSEKLGNKTISLLFAVSYLLCPAIQNANLNDVHGVTFAAPFLLFAFYFLQKRRFNLFLIMGAIALTCREDSALLLFMMGIYSWFIMKERKISLITMIICFLWFFIWYERMALRSILGLPEFIIMEGAESHWDHLSNVFKNPFYLISFLAKKYNIQYFVYLFGPVIFLSLFSPKTLLIASPMFAINLLSSYYYTHDVEHHYSATIVPFIYISAIYGLNNLRNLLRKREKNVKLIYVSILILVCSSAIFFVKSNLFDAKNWKITEHHKIIKKIIATIPEQASLSAERRLATHAAERRELYVFNDNVNEVDYILYDFYAKDVRLVTRKSFHLPYIWPDNDSIRTVLSDRSYGIVQYEDGVCLFKKGANYENGVKKIAIASGNEIRNELNTEIFPNIYCKGYNKYEILKYYVQAEKLGSVYWKNALHFTCFWLSNNNDLKNYNFVFKIKNDSSEFIFSHQPVFNLYSSSHWQDNEVIRDEIFWELPENTKNKKFEVFVKLSEDQGFSYLFNLDLE